MELKFVSGEDCSSRYIGVRTEFAEVQTISSKNVV